MAKKQGIVSVLAILILVVLSAGVGFGAYFLSRKTKESLLKKPAPIFQPEEPAIVSPSLIPTPSPSSSPAETLTVNFSQTGNALNWDSKTESYTEEWKLLYEAPGNPSLSVNLVFGQNSVCDFGSGDEVCDKSKLSNGDLVKVEGNKAGDIVSIMKLKKL
ncbi:MAG TPA: hypothetical protein VMW29_02165 [Candidatus Bathyarchaeia archaeon]|nr:hypothetical protein [Candidatus Bathyarchaeia archaeon]